MSGNKPRGPRRRAQGQRATGGTSWGKMTWTEPKQGHVPAVGADRDVRCACHYRSQVQTAPLAAATATHKRTSRRKACPPRTIVASCCLTKSRTRRSKAWDAYTGLGGRGLAVLGWWRAPDLLILAFAADWRHSPSNISSRPRHYSQAGGYPSMLVYARVFVEGGGVSTRLA